MEMKKQFLLGFLAGAILFTAGFAIAQAPKRAIADFRIIITVDQVNNGVNMVCEKGCAWETASFHCNQGDVCTSTVDAY